MQDNGHSVLAWAERGEKASTTKNQDYERGNRWTASKYEVGRATA